MAKKTTSSRRWLREHFTDPYVKQAQKEGYRSRAVYKLLEIHHRDKLFKPGMVVVDLGAAPGGWSQVLSQLVKPKGRVFALDILEMEPVEGVEFIQGDFTEESVLSELKTLIEGANIDWVVSDMAPNMSGNDSVDIPRSVYLAELALDFALQALPQEGGFLSKVFQGDGTDKFISEVKRQFKAVDVRKPKASRGRSREIYVLARNRRLKPL